MDMLVIWQRDYYDMARAKFSLFYQFLSLWLLGKLFNLWYRRVCVILLLKYHGWLGGWYECVCYGLVSCLFVVRFGNPTGSYHVLVIY